MVSQKLSGNKIQMTEATGIENIRVLISAHLTKILMLYGRLSGDYNTRYLPVTVSSILMLINELELLEKKYYGFSDILSENIERREKYTNVFLIPPALQKDPSTKGLRDALRDLSTQMVPSYRDEEKKFLENLAPSISLKTKLALIQKTLKNCDLLLGLLEPAGKEIIQQLKAWCEAELVRLG